MKQLSDWMLRTLANPEDHGVLATVKAEVEELCSRFPVPGIEN
jgi:glycine/serine hydroxymethyltransferase